MNQTQSLPPDAIEALKRGSKIEAIKHTRAALGLDLVTAKDMVEKFLLSNVDLNMQYMAASKNLSSGCLKYLVLFLIVIAVAGYYFWQWTCCSPQDNIVPINTK